MRLAEFIERRREKILAESSAYARSLPALDDASLAVLRDHLPLILDIICEDLRSPQNRDQSIQKSLGHAPDSSAETPARTHGTMRAKSGLSIEQVVAEYRVLRSCVLRLWVEDNRLGAHDIDDIMRFNEAIDQAIAESVAYYSAEVEKWRNIFISIIGHDLRNPLGAMLMTGELLSRVTTGRAAEYVQAVLRDGRRMTNLLDSLLDYNNFSLGRGMVIQRARADLAGECEQELEILRRAFPHRQFSISLKGNTSGLFDSSRVREALANLISNAVQYSPDDSVIGVDVTGTDATVEISTVNVANAISPETLLTLFDPLQRLPQHEAQTGNLGLGLFIVREIARAHHGTASASAIEGGIRFTLSLPRAEVAEHKEGTLNGGQ